MADPAPQDEPGRATGPTLARRLGLFDATMFVVSGIVGSGIFINPYVVAQIVHTPFLIVAVWVAGGALALLGAFVFAELSTVLPKVGGQYAYFRAAFHPLVGFLHGWSILWIVQSGATAAVSVACAEYFAQLVGLPPAAVTPMAVALLLLLAGFHALGIRPGALLINVVTFGKSVALALLIGLALFLPRPVSGLQMTPLVPAGWSGLTLLSAFFAGLVPTMFSYGGWQSLNYVAEEVRRPERNLPRAILLGVVIVIALYVGANVAYLHVLTAPALAATKTPAAATATALLGGWGGRAIGLLIVISTFGFLNLALLAAPRVYYAMAADGVFFRGLARISPRFRVPTAAILLQGGLAAAFALTPSYERLLSYAVFADWIFFALAGIALMVFRRTMPSADRPFPTPLYPWVPLVFTLAGAGIVVNLFFTESKNALLGTAVVLAGIPVYFLWRRK